MVFEHFALNVKDPKSLSEWYVENCEMKIVRSLNEPPYTRFLSDKSNRVVLEVYSNPDAKIPDYEERDPLEFHFALKVDNAQAVKDKLVKAGANLFKEEKLDDGSLLIMLRDPYGIPLQLCQRSNPMF